MQSIVPRSYLFVPGNRPDRFEKAFVSGAHAVIIDLEDSVPGPEKSSARTAVAAWLSHRQPTIVRLNGTTTEWFTADAELCGLPGLARVMLPKCETSEEIELLGNRKTGLLVLPIIETAQGFWNAVHLARNRFVDRLVFGSVDLSLDLSITGDTDELTYFRSHLVLVSRLAGVHPPIDGVCDSIHDEERLRSEILRARRFGFGGKLCIHPKQVPLVNECFLPTPEEIAWARRVVDAASASRGAVVALDGKMIDRPIIARAESILRQCARDGK